jgi:hypothetical protein
MVYATLYTQSREKEGSEPSWVFHFGGGRGGRLVGFFELVFRGAVLGLDWEKAERVH